MVGRDARTMNVDCQWGLSGLRAIARDRIVIIADVLSFSTATTVAVGKGATIFPCEWNDDRAAALAKAERAELASKRGQGQYTLAPASLRDLTPGFRMSLKWRPIHVEASADAPGIADAAATGGHRLRGPLLPPHPAAV